MAVALVRDGGRVLVGRRTKPPLAGFHEFPGGRALPGETIERAAERETLEEAGLAVRAERLLVRRRHAYAHATVELAFVVCSPRHPSADPRSPFRWIPLDRLPGLRFPPANAPAVGRLLES